MERYFNGVYDQPYKLNDQVFTCMRIGPTQDLLFSQIYLYITKLTTTTASSSTHAKQQICDSFKCIRHRYSAPRPFVLGVLHIKHYDTLQYRYIVRRSAEHRCPAVTVLQWDRRGSADAGLGAFVEGQIWLGPVETAAKIYSDAPKTMMASTNAPPIRSMQIRAYYGL